MQPRFNWRSSAQLDKVRTLEADSTGEAYSAPPDHIADE